MLLYILLFINIALPIVLDASDVKCSDADPDGPYAKWIILHEGCWGECKRGHPTRKGGPHILSHAKRTESCGDRHVVDAPRGATPPPCRLSVAGKLMRAYCGIKPGYLKPAGGPTGGGSGAGSRLSCAANTCDGVTRGFTTNHYCKIDNFGAPGSGIGESRYECPPGTQQQIGACFEQYDWRDPKQNQEYICRVKRDVISIAFTDTWTGSRTIENMAELKGYYTVTKASGATRWNPDGTEYTAAAAHELEDDILDILYDEWDERDNLREIKNDLKDARFRLKKEWQHTEHRKENPVHSKHQRHYKDYDNW